MILVLGALKCGLYSRDEVATQKCLQLLHKIVQSLRKEAKRLNYDERFSEWFTRIVYQPEDSILHNSVLQSVSECLETHNSLAKDVAALYMSVFKSSDRQLNQLPMMLKVAYADDIFMLYETMHSILQDLYTLDQQRSK